MTLFGWPSVLSGCCCWAVCLAGAGQRSGSHPWLLAIPLPLFAAYHDSDPIGYPDSPADIHHRSGLEHGLRSLWMVKQALKIDPDVELQGKVVKRSSQPKRIVTASGVGDPQRGPQSTVGSSQRYTARSMSMPYRGVSTFSIRLRRPVPAANNAVSGAGSQLPMHPPAASVNKLFGTGSFGNFVSNGHKSSSAVIDLNKSNPQTAAQLRALFGW